MNLVLEHITVFFDIIIMAQLCCLYPHKSKRDAALSEHDLF